MYEDLTLPLLSCFPLRNSTDKEVPVGGRTKIESRGRSSTLVGRS